MERIPIRELNQQTSRVLVLDQEAGGELTHFVAYDSRLLAAAVAARISVASPGFQP